MITVIPSRGEESGRWDRRNRLPDSSLRLGMTAWLVLAAACSSGGGASAPAATPRPADAQVSELRTQMTELLERLDVLNDRISRLEQAQSELQSLPPRTAEPAAAPHAAQPAAPAAPSAAVIGAQIATAYRDAIVLYGRNRLADARAAFQRVFDTDPHSELADNALFWIGETYFSAGQYAEAMRYYTRVTRDYSDQNKAPDAMYKLALAYEKTSDLELAQKTLQELIARYPYSTPAASAKAELKRIKY